MRGLSLLSHPGLSRQGVAIGRVCQPAGVHLPARGCGVWPPTRGPALCIPAAPAVKPSGSAALPCVGSGCAAQPRRKPRTPQPRRAVLFSNRGARVPTSDSVPLMGSQCACPHGSSRALLLPRRPRPFSILPSTSGGSTAVARAHSSPLPGPPSSSWGVRVFCLFWGLCAVCPFLPAPGAEHAVLAPTVCRALRHA